MHPGQHILESDYSHSAGGIGYLTGPADFGRERPSTTKWTNHPKAWCEPGDVLATVKGAGVGKVNLAPNERTAIGRQLMAVRPKTDLADQAFVYYLLTTHLLNLRGRALGSTVPGLGREDIESLDCPLPPLPAQKRIVVILSEQMVGVERSQAAAEAQFDAANALLAAFLRDVFASAEARTWRTRRVEELCDRIDYGYTASADAAIPEPRFLRITDIQDGRVEWARVPGCRISPEDETAKRLTDGDIVFARTGATTGKSFLIRRPPRAVFASYLIRLRPGGEILGDYLYSFLQSNGYWEQIRASARGGAQPNVNATLLGAITLPVPSISTQSRIAAVLAEKMATADQLRTGAERQLALISALPPALLRRAFSGEL